MTRKSVRAQCPAHCDSEGLCCGLLPFAVICCHCPARGTGPRKSSHLSLRFSDLFLIQRNLRDKRRFCMSAPPAVREAACQSLRTCSPSQTGALQTTTLGILPLFVQANSRVLSNAGDSDGQNSNFMQAGDSDGRGDSQKPCFQSASNCAASKSLSC
jgi:hypothetical protein